MQQASVGIKSSLSTAREFLQFYAKICTTQSVTSTDPLQLQNRAQKMEPTDLDTRTRWSHASLAPRTVFPGKKKKKAWVWGYSHAWAVYKYATTPTTQLLPSMHRRLSQHSNISVMRESVSQSASPLHVSHYATLQGSLVGVEAIPWGYVPEWVW